MASEVAPPYPDEITSPTLYEPRQMKLTIYQDPSCYWCCIGEREMHQALKTLREREEDVRVTLEFKPFVVDAGLPVDTPVSKQERYRQKYGSRWTAIQQFVSSRGAACGLDFKFGGVIRFPLLSQRLIMRAYQLGGGEAQQALIEEISRRVCEQEGDVGCLGVLSDAAAATGLMCKEQAIAFLTSHDLEDAVEKELLEARKRGINGVPFAVVDDKYAISGGHPSEVYLELFTKVLRKEVPGAVS